jgi:hypothetical protein
MFDVNLGSAPTAAFRAPSTEARDWSYHVDLH